MNKSGGNVENLINTARKLVIKNNREIVHCVINIRLLLSKQNIGFRSKSYEAAYDMNDSQNNHGNFLEDVNYLSTYDPIMQVHIKFLKNCTNEKNKRSEKISNMAVVL